MIEPKDVDIDLPGGGAKTFVLSKFPAITGREIITQYPTSAAPNIGDYKLNEDLMVKLMCFVGVPVKGGDPIMLTTKELINNHIPDWETLIKVEWEMMKYNSSFFGNGKIFDILSLVSAKAEGLVSKTLMNFAASLSKKD